MINMNIVYFESVPHKLSYCGKYLVAQLTITIAEKSPQKVTIYSWLGKVCHSTQLFLVNCFTFFKPVIKDWRPDAGTNQLEVESHRLIVGLGLLIGLTFLIITKKVKYLQSSPLTCWFRYRSSYDKKKTKKKLSPVSCFICQPPCLDTHYYFSAILWTLLLFCRPPYLSVSLQTCHTVSHLSVCIPACLLLCVPLYLSVCMSAS